jgi:transcriptional regulator with XRE-family HTH domain
VPVKKNAIAVADKNPFARAIGHRLRVLRAHLSVSQVKFAQLLNVTQDAISRIERAAVAGMTYQVMEGLLKVCDENRQISPCWLFFGLGPMELPAADPNGTTTRAHQDGRLTVNPQSAIRNPQCDDGTTRARQDGRLTGGDSDRV